MVESLLLSAVKNGTNIGAHHCHIVFFPLICDYFILVLYSKRMILSGLHVLNIEKYKAKTGTDGDTYCHIASTSVIVCD